MHIPAIGGFKLVEVPASFDSENKLIYPPGYQIHFTEQEVVKGHQLSYLATNLHCDHDAAQQELEQFGETLKKVLYNKAFLWKGLGTLELTDGLVHFHAAPHLNHLLQPVPADRVHRDRSRQTVTTVEKSVQEVQEEMEEVPKKRRSPAMIIAWILIVLCLAFIVFYFYKQGLKPSSTGNQMKIKVERYSNDK
jgi:hypothetical protein